MASRPQASGWGRVGGGGGSRVSLKSFHVVPETFGDSRRLRSESSPKREVSGWVVGSGGEGDQVWSQSRRRAGGQSIMKHTNTQLCVDSVPLLVAESTATGR